MENRTLATLTIDSPLGERTLPR